MPNSVYSYRLSGHIDVIRHGIENRNDIYKAGFILTQIFALIYLTVCVIRKHKILSARRIAHVKLRLVQLNLMEKHKSLKSDIAANPPQITFGETEWKQLGLDEIVSELPEYKEQYLSNKAKATKAKKELAFQKVKEEIRKKGEEEN